MLSLNRIRILDLDSSLTSQARLIQAIKNTSYPFEIADLRKQASSVRYWANKKDLTTLRESLPQNAAQAITFYGSGDFHHITALLLESLRRQVTLIVFDHHPDWDGLSFNLSCGSWVSRAQFNPAIEKILLLGPSSDDLGSGLATASLKAFNQGKLEIYPFQRAPTSVVFRAIADNECVTKNGNFISSRIQWNNLIDKDINVFLRGLLKKIPTECVYVSIDKDCLTREAAITNWEQGQITLEWLLSALTCIKNEKTLIGVDITGEYSAIETQGLLKGLFSRYDHRFAEPVSDIKSAQAINEATNLQILQALLS